MRGGAFSPDRQCVGKRRYTSKSQAKAAIAALKAKGNWSGRMSAYRCPHCELFHIGHTPRVIIEGRTN